jgi:Fe-S cluster assembly iron-binding protein IscA
MTTNENHSQEDVMVSLTDSAVIKFKETVEKQGKAGDGVRIFAVPGG